MFMYPEPFRYVQYFVREANEHVECDSFSLMVLKIYKVNNQ